MAYQIVHNPRTGEVRYIDLMDDPTGAERARLFQQGWISGTGPGTTTATPPPDVYQPTFGPEGGLIIDEPTKTIPPDIKQRLEARGVRAAEVAVKPSDTKLRPHEIKALEQAMANIAEKQKTGVSAEEYKALGPEAQKYLLIKSEELGKAPGIIDRIRDITLEALSLGKVETRTFNEDDLGREYEEKSKELVKQYEKLQREEGTSLSREQFTEKMLGKKKDYVGTVIEMQPKLDELAQNVSKGMIPFYGTKVTWAGSPTWAKGLGIAADVLWVIPFVGGISTGVRAVVTGSRLATAARATGGMVLAEIRAPITMIKHPIKTLKTTLEPIETAVRPSKLPLGGMEIRYSTQRLPVIGKPKEAMAYRDYVAQKLIEGKGGKFEYGEVFEPKAIQGIRPVVVHGSPDIRPFLEGATVQAGREGGLFISPTVHTRFTAASAFGDQPVGGIRGILMINDEAALTKLTGSGKLYKGKAELEKVIPGGVELPKPSQVLMTRDASGDKLAILVVGKPLTKAQIAKFKMVGSYDTLRTIYTPSISITNQSTRVGRLVDKLSDTNREISALEEEIRLMRRQARATVEVNAARARMARLVKQSEALRRQVIEESTGRAGYAALSTRPESAFIRSRSYDVTRQRMNPEAPRTIDRTIEESTRRPPARADGNGRRKPPGRTPRTPGEPRPPRVPDTTRPRKLPVEEKLTTVRPRPFPTGKVSTEIKEVMKDMPPGTYYFPMGTHDVIDPPPYTRQTRIYIRRKEPKTGRGSMQTDLQVKGGLPIEDWKMKQGFNIVGIKSGKKMSHKHTKTDGKQVKGPRAFMAPSGKIKKQRRGVL